MVYKAPATHPLSDTLQEHLLPKTGDEENVSLSLILPVYNCPEAVGETLESLKQQNYSPLEVIVVDAQSTDQTLEIVHSYGSMISRIYTVADYALADMLNRGLTLATGRYLAFLFPGTTYLSPHAFQTFSEKIREADYPDFIYCGSFQREINKEPKTILLPYDRRVLEKGGAFASLPACWFRSDLFERVGKFNTHCLRHANFDLFCRIVKEKNIHVAAVDRIFVDYNRERSSFTQAFHGAAETWRLICRHFGLKKALFWLISLF